MSSIGYARVSSYGQSLEVQLEKLSFCDTVFQEKQSARNDDREQLQRCLNYLNDGDSLVITKLDRLARSTRDLLNIMSRLDSMKVKLVVLDQQIDTSTPSGRLLVTMLGSIAEFENDLRKDRQADGIAHARKIGVKFGRKKALSEKQVQEMRQKRSEGVKIKDLMSDYSLSKASVYRALGASEDVDAEH
jgi:DNA invertase Pin-like site-specific DNA recombinase